MEIILTNSMKFYQKWEIKNICLIILIISLYAERTIKGLECVGAGYVKNLAIRRMFYFENIKTKFFCKTWCCYIVHLIMFPKRSLGTYCFYYVSSSSSSSFLTFFSQLFCPRVFSLNYSIYEVESFLVWIGIMCSCAEPI